MTNTVSAATIMLWPSGAALPTIAAPMAWLAPPRFSTMTCWPHAVGEAAAPTSRAITSLTPPGAAGTTMVMGLVG